ncbi:hypothetical protein X566_19525 [Afipia sp. P52-10]|jgi:hypothetical protein|uniref:DUF2155 domain-containing protein n=1 Tax=Afipia sp. P52-10 TaxID=1429916 RepID=UPI0003DF06EA|nr:DUF2155 domain-containing protein [Afipia sp. P52-10]ETR74978.1 hypothetical protein X566_19525 [Afipia sp. P52-10]
MLRSASFILLAAMTAAGLVYPVPSLAQYFGNQPPRPPGNVGAQERVQDPDAEDVPDIPQGRILPAPNRLPPGGSIPPPGSVQSQPLPMPPQQQPGSPPAGPAVATPNPLPGLPPGQRQPRGTPAAAPATVQPGDEIVTAPPAQKIVNKQAVFAGLDKITGRIIKFDVDIGETVQFGALRVKPQACYTRPATEATNTDAFVEVDEITLQGEVKRIFSGWMFAASPGLHGVEHPIYDVWLTDCKGPDATVASAQPEPPPRAPPAQKQRQPARRQAPPPPPPPQYQPQYQPQPAPLPGFR